MKISFFGAARTVTGSQHMVETERWRILLECGLFQGRRKDTFERNKNFPFSPSSVDAVVLSHAHIDHSGNLPNLIVDGFNGDIVSTHATRDLCAWMLPDSGHIQERDVEYVNRRRGKKGEPPVQPIYTQEDAFKSLNYFVTQPYERPREILPGVKLTFLDAGHMLGSATVVLDIEDEGESKRLVFSGDIGRKGIPIIRDPQYVDHADVLIMESTYGNRLHPPYPDAEKEMERIINETYRRGGSVVIPAFAVGRTQQLVFTLHQLATQGDIPHLPIYVDSPLAVNATGVFRLHPQVYDRETRDFMMQNGRRIDPFGFDDLTYIRNVEESKQLNFHRDPAIIISASGMAEFGRVVHHIKHRIDDERNTMLIVGWQAANTLGRKLVDGVSPVKIFGEEYPVRAHVEVLNGFSGHADRDELMQWVGAIDVKPSRTFLVHGEEDAALALADDLHGEFGLTVDVPEWKQSFEV